MGDKDSFSLLNKVELLRGASGAIDVVVIWIVGSTEVVVSGAFVMVGSRGPSVCLCLSSGSLVTEC